MEALQCAQPAGLVGQHVGVEEHEQASTGQRDTTITRLAVLKAAAEFAASRPQLKSGEVLKIAASWERWVNRDTGDD